MNDEQSKYKEDLVPPSPSAFCFLPSLTTDHRPPITSHMTDTPVVSLDSQLAALLTDLSEVQRKLLALIGEKRTLLLAANVAGLASLQPREQLLIEQLHDCQQRRATLLAD